VAATDTLKTFDELMESADVPEQISGQGPMTFFAPTDAAFAAMPKAKLDTLKEDPKAVKELLLNLMVKKDISPGSLPFAGKITTLGGGVLTASQAVASESDTGPLGLASVNDAKVVKRVPVSKGRRI
ncbi:MAG: fasciclin domain-containing protein, partial [Phycisphaerales bacterium]